MLRGKLHAHRAKMEWLRVETRLLQLQGEVGKQPAGPTDLSEAVEAMRKLFEEQFAHPLLAPDVAATKAEAAQAFIGMSSI